MQPFVMLDAQPLVQVLPQQGVEVRPSVGHDLLGAPVPADPVVEKGVADRGCVLVGQRQDLSILGKSVSDY